MKIKLQEIGIVGISMMASSALNYLYHIYMARALTPEEYGELFSLLSLFLVISVVFMAIETTVSKFVVTYRINGKIEKIGSIVYSGSLKMTLFGVFLLIVATPLLIALSNFLGIPLPLVATLFLSIPLGMSASVYQGVLRGLERFKGLGLMLSVPQFFKLLFGGILVSIGLGVLGGILGILLSMVTSIILGVLLLREFFGVRRNETLKITEMLNYGIFTTTVLFLYTLLVNLDVFLAKHYLSPELAGEYSALSLMGRMVLFASEAVNVVMFPKFVESRERRTLNRRALYGVMVISSLLSGTLILAYALNPGFIIGILYGGKYLQIEEYLMTYSVAMLVLALMKTVINYGLAVENRKTPWVLLSTGVLEVVLITLNHASIQSIVTSLFVSVTIGFVISLILA